MKSGKLLGAALLLISLFSLQLYADYNNSEVATITVYGDGEVLADPDMINIFVNLSSFQKEVAAAKQENDELLAGVREVTESFAINNDDLDISNFSMQPIYEDWRMEKSLKGYRVIRTITIKLVEISNYNSLIESLINAGITEISGVEYQSSRKAEHFEKARDLALQKAQNKAKQMAAVYDMKIGKARYIYETSLPTMDIRGGRHNTMSYAVGMTGEYGNDAIDNILGKISFGVNVSVVFELLEK